MILIYYLVFAVAFYLAYKAVKLYKYHKVMATIPGPKGNFILGNLWDLLVKPETQFSKIRNYSSNYYPIYKLTTPYVAAVSFLHPNDIEQLLSSSKHLSKSIVYNFLNSWLGTGLLTSSGKKWQSRRKILTPAFHFNILQEFLTIFNEETQKLVEELEQECDKAEFSVVPYITQFTLQSISETAMGFTNIDKQTQNEYKNAVYAMGTIMVNRLAKPWLLIKSLYNLTALSKEEKRIVGILHNFSNKIINEREKELKLKDIKNESTYSSRKRLAMLDLLLTAKNLGANIDHEGIREEVDTFMFEGHDTTSLAISFILLTLAHHKNIQDKVFEEISTVLGPNKIPNYNDLQELKYTERCIKEALRLFPSVPFIARLAAQDFQTTTGYTILKGTVLHLHIFDIHRNPRYYPDPLKFDPDRFLFENSIKRHPFTYIPFSAGPRNCIGQRFALLELKAVLCGILRKYCIHPITDMFDIKFRTDLVLRPMTDIKIRISHREKR